MNTKLHSAFPLLPSAFALLAAFTLFTTAPSAPAQSPPVAATLAATNVISIGPETSVILTGTVHPGGLPATAWFEWSSVYDDDHGNSTAPQSVGGGTNVVPVSFGLSNLTAGLTYQYRLVASNSLGVTHGAEVVFWSPTLTLNGPNPFTNECHEAYVDPGATASAFPPAIAAGDSHGLALKADGTVLGWGNNDYGQITIPAVATNVVAIEAGQLHSLVLKADGTVLGWGHNGYGQTNVPADATNVVVIVAGFRHNLALQANGAVLGWGAGRPGTSGAPHYGQATIPVDATNGTAIAGGYWHSLAVIAGGTVLGWGNNDAGQTTIPATATGVVAVAAGRYHSLALRSDGTIVGWGRNTYGQANSPASATNVVAIAASADYSLALKAGGTVVGWGENRYGQATGVPNPVSPNASTGVVTVAGQRLTNVSKIAAGPGYSLAHINDGTVVGWGAPSYGLTTIPLDVYTLNLPVESSGTVDPNTPGSYELTYSTTNSLGAVGTTTRTVQVVDTTPPVLTLLGDNPLTLVIGASFVDPGATATDLCAGDLTGSIVVTNTVNTGVPAVYTATHTVADANGNSTATNRTVLVVDLPMITDITAGLSGTNLYSGSRMAMLKAAVNPNGLETVAFIDYGMDTSYSGSTGPATIPAGYIASNLTTTLEGLIPGVTYHWQVRASNELGAAYVSDQTFTVPAIFVVGDANGDGLVDQTEFDAVAQNYWGRTSRPYMTNLFTDGEGYWQMTLTNAAAWNFIVEVSTNLVDWHYLCPAWPSLEFYDPDATNQPQRYYRLSWP